MKMLKGILFAATILCLAGAAWAQGQQRKTEAQETRDAISKLLNNVETTKQDPMRLNAAINELRVKLMNNRNAQVYMAPDTTRRVTQAFTHLFNALNADGGINQTNKLRIIETIGFSDNSSEAQEFFLSLMDNGTDKQKEMALWSLSPKGVHGDEIYSKIKELIKKGALKEAPSLGYLKRANSTKALPEIQKFLSSTKDRKSFIGAGLLLCDYQDPALIDVLIDRLDDFQTKEPENAKEALEYHDPTIAVDSKVLRKYIEINEAEKVEKALRILRRKGTSGENDLPLLARKLESTQAKTRIAVLDFLKDQINGGNVSPDKTTAIVDRAEAAENNAEVKTRVQMLKDAIGQRRAKEKK